MQLFFYICVDDMLLCSSVLEQDCRFLEQGLKEFLALQGPTSPLPVPS